MTEIFGTLGPKCANEYVLRQMLENGMSGIRLNLSHMKLMEAKDMLDALHEASEKTGIFPKLLIDMQGPELRTGVLEEDLVLKTGTLCKFGTEKGCIPIPQVVMEKLEPGTTLLLDDGKIHLLVEQGNAMEGFVATVILGGILKSRKSVAVPGMKLYPPTLTEEDIENIRVAFEFGVYGVMQPFVRNQEDLIYLRNVLQEAGAGSIKIYAKIENQDGVKNLRSFAELADEIIIARGDLGNAIPLWELPRIQKEIAKICKEMDKPFMVVTQMLASMEKSAVPTRAEVSDIFNAILDGASSVMVTGETAVGQYPVEVIRYLANTVKEAEKFKSQL